jgi:hypothetical protein
MVNVDAEDFVLFIGMLLDALKGRGPYFVSAFSGEQGSARSTVLRYIAG